MADQEARSESLHNHKPEVEPELRHLLMAMLSNLEGQEAPEGAEEDEDNICEDGHVFVQAEQPHTSLLFCKQCGEVKQLAPDEDRVGF